jgi:hypothetical protein
MQSRSYGVQLVIEQIGVGVQRHLCRRVPEHALQRQHIDAGGGLRSRDEGEPPTPLSGVVLKSGRFLGQLFRCGSAMSVSRPVAVSDESRVPRLGETAATVHRPDALGTSWAHFGHSYR